MIRFSCPACGKVLKAPDHGVGRKIPCPRCGQRLLIPPPVQVQNKTILGQPLPDSAASPPHGQVLSAPHSPTGPIPNWLNDVRAAEENTRLLTASEDRGERLEEVQITDGGFVEERRYSWIKWVWRLCTPSMLLFSMCLLPLPFLEVNCTANGQPLATQSGLQAMYGGYSVSSLADKMPRDGAGAWQAATGRERWKVWPSLVMVLVPMVVLAAAVVSLVIPLGWLRSALASAGVGASLVLLLGQVVWGFPLENAIIASLAKSATPGPDDFWNPGLPRRQDEEQLASKLAAAAIRVRFTPWFYLWVLLIAGSLVPLTVEGLVELAVKYSGRHRPATA